MTTRLRSDSGERAATRRPAAGRDGGFSFIETVVTIVLLGVVIVPVMAAVRASIQTSATSRSAAQLETALINAADRINRADMACDYTNFAQSSVETEGWDREQARVAHEWYDPTTNGWSSGVDGCRFPGRVTQDLVQKVTIEITTPDGKITRDIQVVKSNV